MKSIFYSCVHPKIREQLLWLDVSPYHCGGAAMPASWWLAYFGKEVETFTCSVWLDADVSSN